MQALKYVEYFFAILFFYSNAIVFKCKLPVTIYSFNRNFYLRAYILFFEFDSINDQVLKKLFYLSRVTAYNRQRCVLYICSCIIYRYAKICQYVIKSFIAINLFQFFFSAYP